MLFALLASATTAVAWRFTAALAKRAGAVSATLASSVVFLAQPTLAALAPAPWDATVQYEVLQKGTGTEAKVSDLVNIRFTGSYNGKTFDDTFKAEQPYTYRAGVGLLLPGLDNAVVHMRVGDKLHLEFDGDNAFKDGRPSAPGIPRIPPGGKLIYDVVLESLPGTDEDIILGDL